MKKKHEKQRMIIKTEWLSIKIDIKKRKKQRKEKMHLENRIAKLNLIKNACRESNNHLSI